MILVKVKNLSGELLLHKTLNSFPVSIGRDPEATISIRDNGVSTKHAELNWDGSELTFRDLGSRNGTFHDNVEVKTITLRPPCIFLLGNVVTLEIEEPSPAVAQNMMPALASTRAVAPKPFKVSAPVVAKPIEEVVPVEQPPPVEAMAIEIFGWEEYWLKLSRVTPRELLIVMLALGGIFFLLHYAVFRESFVISLISGPGAALGCAIAAAIIAACSALPGLLFRHSYDFKPLFIQQSVGLMLLSIAEQIFKPAMVFETMGPVFRILILPVLALAWFTACYVWLFTTFPHRFEKRLFIASIAMGAVIFVVQSKDIVTVDRQTLLKRAMLGEFRTTRSLAGSVYEVRDLTDEIKEFGKQYPAK